LDTKQVMLYKVSMKKLSINTGRKYIDNFEEIDLTKLTLYNGMEKDGNQIYQLDLLQLVKNKSKLALEKIQLFLVALGQCTVYMISKLKELPSFTTINTEKDMLSLMVINKNLIFAFNGGKQSKVNLVEADDMFH
jgi:hypothetical protein